MIAIEPSPEPVEASRTALSMPAYQVAAVNSAARFTWHNWARQTGKSFALSLRRVLRGLARRRTQVLLSASERQSREMMDKVRMHCRMLQVACEFRESDCFGASAIRRLEAALPGGVRVIALPANPATARGFSGDVLLDEFAMHRDDREIWSALFPTLLRGGGELDVASTPRGRGNLFHKLRTNERFEHTTVTIHDAVAAGLPADVALLRSAMDDEAAFRQEFECEFVDESTALLSHELITRCQDAGLSVEPDEARLSSADARVFAGVDVGRTRDLTVIWLWEALDGQLVTRGVVELSNQPFSVQRRVIESLLSRRAVRRLAIDRTGLGAMLAEELAARFGEHRVEGVTFSSGIKSDLAGRLRVQAERGLLRIPVDDRIRQDWHALERVVTPAGGVRYESDRGRGGHSDRFWAAALGLYAVDASSGVIEYVPGRALQFARMGAW